MKQYNNEVKNKIFTYFNNKFKLKESTKGFYRLDCNVCHGYNTMGINFGSNSLHCFKCEHHSNPATMIMEIEQFDNYNQVWNLLNTYENLGPLHNFENTNILKDPKYDTVSLPKSFRPIIQLEQNSILGKAAIKYLKNKRGFSIKKLSHNGVGYCTNGEYAGYVIFPFIALGQLRFFQGRKFTEIGTKMKNPPMEDFGIGKSELIYNEDALYIYKTVFLVESVTNALTLGDKAIAILGKSISPQQLNTIIKSPCENIIIILDEDAKDKSIKTAMALNPFKKCKIIFMPKDKDVNDLGKKETLKLVKESKYLNYSNIIELYIDNESPSIHTYN